MTAYHFNTILGEAGECRAKQGKCPFGPAEEHFTSKEAVYEFIKEAYGDEAMGSTSKTPEKKYELMARKLNRGGISVTHEVAEVEGMKILAELNRAKSPNPLSDDMGGVITGVLPDGKRIALIDRYSGEGFVATDGKEVESNYYFVYLKEDGNDYYDPAYVPPLSSTQAAALVAAHSLANNYFYVDSIENEKAPGEELARGVKDIEAMLRGESFSIPEWAQEMGVEERFQGWPASLIKD